MAASLLQNIAVWQHTSEANRCVRLVPICGAIHHLEVHHIVSRGMGGCSRPEIEARREQDHDLPQLPHRDHRAPLGAAARRAPAQCKGLRPRRKQVGSVSAIGRLASLTQINNCT